MLRGFIFTLFLPASAFPPPARLDVRQCYYGNAAEGILGRCSCPQDCRRCKASAVFGCASHLTCSDSLDTCSPGDDCSRGLCYEKLNAGLPYPRLVSDCSACAKSGSNRCRHSKCADHSCCEPNPFQACNGAGSLTCPWGQESDVFKAGGCKACFKFRNYEGKLLHRCSIDTDSCQEVVNQLAKAEVTDALSEAVQVYRSDFQCCSDDPCNYTAYEKAETTDYYKLQYEIEITTVMPDDGVGSLTGSCVLITAVVFISFFLPVP